MLNRMPSLVFLLLFSFAVSAQSSAEMKADSLALIGMNLMDEGEIAAAIDYLEQAKVIFPGKSTYDYEIGLAHYKGGAYDAALPVFRSLLKGADSQPLYYQMLGNTNDVLGKRKKAKKDLVRIPNKGKGLDNGGRNSGTSDCNDGFNGMFFLTSKVPREMQIITALEALAKATAPETYEIAIDNVEIEK